MGKFIQLIILLIIIAACSSSEINDNGQKDLLYRQGLNNKRSYNDVDTMRQQIFNKAVSLTKRASRILWFEEILDMFKIDSVYVEYKTSESENNVYEVVISKDGGKEIKRNNGKIENEELDNYYALQLLETIMSTLYSTNSLDFTMTDDNNTLPYITTVVYTTDTGPMTYSDRYKPGLDELDAILNVLTNKDKIPEILSLCDQYIFYQ